MTLLILELILNVIKLICNAIFVTYRSNNKYVIQYHAKILPLIIRNLCKSLGNDKMYKMIQSMICYRYYQLLQNLKKIKVKIKNAI